MSIPLMNFLVAALAGVGVPMGVGKRPAVDGTKPFIVAWPDGGLRSAATMKANDRSTVVITFHCLGLTPQSADVALNKLTTAVYSLYRTQVDGRLVQYPEALSALPLSRDDDVDPPLYNLTAEWRLSTTPS